MRSTRIIATIIAFALLALAPLGIAGTAQAASTSAERASTVARADGKKPVVGIKIVKKAGKLILKGQVKHGNGKVTVQKATKCNLKTKTCNWKKFDKVNVKKGMYQTRVYAPRKGSWYWRSKVTTKNGTTRSDVWETYKQ